MTIYILDFSSVTDKASLHAYLKKELRLPDYYGNNLDALHDCLSEFSADSIFVLVNTDKMIENIGEYGEYVRAVFRDSAEDKGFVVAIK